MTKVKEQMQGGLNSIFGDQPKKAEQTTIPQKTSTTIREYGKKPVREYKKQQIDKEGNYTGDRITMVLDPGLHQKIKEMAYWDHDTIKDIINRTLQAMVVKYEKVHGTVKPIPLKNQTRSI